MTGFTTIVTMRQKTERAFIRLKVTIANIILATAISLTPSTAFATEPGDTIKTIAGDFDEVFSDLQDAVINRGLVIDYVGDVGKMLERTADAARGADAKPPYVNARYLQFCSAIVTHQAVDADVRNLAMCPYVVFAYEARLEPGKVSVGYRKVELVSSSASQAAQAKVHSLLQAIVNEATGENQ